MTGITQEVTRGRARNLVEFLTRVVQLRSVVVHDVADYEDVIWFSEIPDLPESHVVTQPEFAADGDWIAVERPKIPPAPPLPADLWDWVANDENTEAEPELRNLDDGEELPDPVHRAFDAYVAVWRQWRENHAARVPLLALYERLFRMKQQADQYGERYETVVAGGLVLVRDDTGPRVRRHLLTMRVEVQYEAKTAKISVRPAADGVRLQLETEMLKSELIPPKTIRDDVLRALEAAGTDLWAEDGLESGLRTWTQAMRFDAEYRSVLVAPQVPASGVLVALAPALILRKRTSKSLLEFYRQIDEQLDTGAAVPPLLGSLIREPDGSAGDGGEVLWQDDELYFPKPYNTEQRDVLRRLATTDGVVVVGPPGTGKSHTIANLISHLLAQGQRVLVTSHTSHALEVLLDKLPDEIRALSVSLVGDGRAGMQELKRSVGTIVTRSTDPGWDTAQIDEKIARKREMRSRAEGERRRHLAAIRDAREGDAREHDLGFGGYRGTLSVIASAIARDRDRYEWAADIDGAEPALSDDEARELVGLAVDITNDQESAARTPIPDYVPPPTFASLCERLSELEALVSEDTDSSRSPGAHPLAQALEHAGSGDRRSLADAVQRLEMARNIARLQEPWEASAFEGVLAGQSAGWRDRSTRTREWVAGLRSSAAQAEELLVSGVLRARPAAARAAVDGLITHLLQGGGFGFGPVRPARVRTALDALGSVKVDARTPKVVADLRRLRTWLDVMVISERAAAAWSTERDLTELPPLSLLANLAELLGGLERTLAAERCRTEIVELAGRMRIAPLPGWGDAEGWHDLRRACLTVDAADALASARAEIARLRKSVAQAGSDADQGDVIPLFLTAIDTHDVDAYRYASEVADARRHTASLVNRRDQLVAALRGQVPEVQLGAIRTDPEWRDRLLSFGAACAWARAHAWLQNVIDASTGGAAMRVATLNDEVRLLTASIGEHLAWRSCLTNLTAAQRQHLNLYQQAMAKYGQGKGKYAATHLANARRELEACQRAVPAWIMPTHRVAESLSPSEDAFDVVVVDEASQSGIDSLFLWWLGKKMVIVGDDQQISPDAVGLNQEPFYKLVDELLQGQPFGAALSPTTSLFDLGDVAFPGNRTHLREHFRCMPEIIAFSNRIAYAAAPLEPLRQFGTDRLPPLRSTHIAGATRTYGVRTQVNRDEAHALVEQVVACVADPAYDGKTLGVVSLTGEDQARYIQHLLLTRLGADELIRRKMKAGDAYAFQGDERDVMFLSMVAAPTERGNRLPAQTADPIKRRFNVAASRARDQVWLFHSVTQSDLNSDCLRARLLEHFSQRDPDPLCAPLQPPVTDNEPHLAFDSLFEQRVYRRIAARGYCVTPQVTAYGYRIDLVVAGGESRLAVECDGDAWHGPERFDRDLLRQQDLERVGWRFVRIRECEYYLDPEEALKPLWAKLHEVGVKPIGASPQPVLEPHGAVGIDAEGTELVVAVLLEGLGQASAEPNADPEPLSNFAAEGSLTAITEDGEEVGTAADPQVAQFGGVFRDGDSDRSPGLSLDPDPSAGDPTTIATSRRRGGYRAWAPRRIRDPRDMRQADLAAVLVEIVAAEGPVLARRAYRLAVQAAGYHRLTQAVLSPLNKAASAAERDGRVIASTAPAMVDRVLRLPSQPAVCIRERGPRDLEEVPPTEIRGVADMLRAEQPRITDLELKRALLAAYERTALTGAASAFLDRSLLAPAANEPDGRQITVSSLISTAPASGTSPATPPPGGKPGTPLADRNAGSAGSPVSFQKILSLTIAKARSLGSGSRSRLASMWQDDELEDERRRVVQGASAAGAPPDWINVASIVTAQLGDWPATARGAVADAAYALASTAPESDRDLLLEPWRTAQRSVVSSAAVHEHAPETCPHGRVVGTCNLIACSGHALGGIRLDEN